MSAAHVTVTFCCCLVLLPCCNLQHSLQASCKEPAMHTDRLLRVPLSDRWCWWSYLTTGCICWWERLGLFWDELCVHGTLKLDSRLADWTRVSTSGTLQDRKTQRNRHLISLHAQRLSALYLSK